MSKTYSRHKEMTFVKFLSEYFPIVMYKGYALLFQNKVNCVLSVDSKIGITVAPGHSCSSTSC